MKKYLCLIGVLGVLLCNAANSYAQKVAVKTNLLYDATTTMNLGLEIGLGKKWSLDLSGNYNPWKFDDETRLRHWGVQPENILCGNGSDENLLLALRAFCDETHPLAFADITYSFYPVLCDLLHIPQHVILVEEDFSLDLSKYHGLN
mgnify:FL=1